MEEIEADPRRLLDPELDMFKPIADVMPEFAEWRAEQLAKTVVAPDGTSHFIVREVLNEARMPADVSGNYQATTVALELARAQAEEGLKKIRNPKLAMADKLSSQDGYRMAATRLPRTQTGTLAQQAAAGLTMRSRTNSPRPTTSCARTAARACTTPRALCSSAPSTTTTGRCLW